MTGAIAAAKHSACHARRSALSRVARPMLRHAAYSMPCSAARAADVARGMLRPGLGWGGNGVVSVLFVDAEHLVCQSEAG